MFLLCINSIFYGQTDQIGAGVSVADLHTLEQEVGHLEDAPEGGHSVGTHHVTCKNKMLTTQIKPRTRRPSR